MEKHFLKFWGVPHINLPPTWLNFANNIHLPGLNLFRKETQKCRSQHQWCSPHYHLSFCYLLLVTWLFPKISNSWLSAVDSKVGLNAASALWPARPSMSLLGSGLSTMKTMKTPNIYSHTANQWHCVIWNSILCFEHFDLWALTQASRTSFQPLTQSFDGLWEYLSMCGLHTINQNHQQSLQLSKICSLAHNKIGSI